MFCFVFVFVFVFVNRNNPLVLGANNSNLPRILQIFGELFVHDVLSDDEAARSRVPFNYATYSGEKNHFKSVGQGQYEKEGGEVCVCTRSGGRSVAFSFCCTRSRTRPVD